MPQVFERMEMDLRVYLKRNGQMEPATLRTGSCFSRMRSEGFSFNSGGLGAGSCLRLVVVAFANVPGRSLWGEAFGEGFGWKRDVSDLVEIARNR